MMLHLCRSCSVLRFACDYWHRTRVPGPTKPDRAPLLGPGNRQEVGRPGHYLTYNRFIDGGVYVLLRRKGRAVIVCTGTLNETRHFALGEPYMVTVYLGQFRSQDGKVGRRHSVYSGVCPRRGRFSLLPHVGVGRSLP